MYMYRLEAADRDIRVISFSNHRVTALFGAAVNRVRGAPLNRLVPNNARFLSCPLFTRVSRTWGEHLITSCNLSPRRSLR